MRRLSTFICAAALSATAAHAAPSAEIGKTVSVVNLVTAELSTERRNLATGDGVRQDELIEAAPTGRSEFRLTDDTKLAVGPGARLKLDRFVYDPDKKSGNIAVDLAKGAFRFMTGVASKPSYVVRVPNASITVRGTIFDVFVQDSGAAWILLHEGGIQACNARGLCRVLDEPGKLLLVNGEGDIGRPFRWASLKGVQGFSFDEAFPFVTAAPTIDPSPIFTKAALVGDEPQKPAKRTPKRERKADSGGSHEPTSTTVTKPKKPVKVVVREPKPSKPVIDGKGPTRVVTKPPRVKKPKTETADADDKRTEGRKWRKIAEATASHWIDRVRSRQRPTDAVDDAPPVRSVPKMNFNRPPVKVPNMGSGGPKGPSSLR